MEYITTLPEDFLQCGGRSVIDISYADEACHGVGSVLRSKAIELVCMKLEADQIEGGVQTFTHHLFAQVEQELAKWEGCTVPPSGSPRHLVHMKKIADYRKLKAETEALKMLERLSPEDKSMLVESYRSYMSDSKIFATETEGEALAEYFGIVLSVSRRRVTREGIVRPYELDLAYTGGGTEVAHYSIFNCTIGDGNCLFYAFGQKIADLWVREGLKQPTGRAEQQAQFSAILPAEASVNCP